MSRTRETSTPGTGPAPAGGATGDLYGREGRR